MANNTAFRAGRFLQGQVTQDFAGCGPGNPPTHPNGDCTFFGGCAPQTNMPGCGYSQQWGSCQASVQNPCITRTEMPGCGTQVGARLDGPAMATRQGFCVTADCTVPGEPCFSVDAGGACHTLPRPFCPPVPVTPQCPQPTPNTQCATTGPECQTHQPPNCPTHNVCCEPTRAPAQCQTNPQVCTVPPGCPDLSIGIACTQFQPQCPQETNPMLDCTFGCTQFGSGCQTSPQQCAIQITKDQACNPPFDTAVGRAVTPTPATRCFICPPRTSGPECTIQQGGGVGAAAAGPIAALTMTVKCNPSAIDACPTMHGCQTQPPTVLCTQVAQNCPTFCGPDCQTQQAACTSVNCTQAGPGCPEPTIGIACTAVPQCPVQTNPILDCTFGCTQFGTGCPTNSLQCPLPVTNDAGCNTAVFDAVGAAQRVAPTPATRCFVCPPRTFDRNCTLQEGAVGAAALPGPGVGPTGWQGCDQGGGHQVGALPFGAQGLGGFGGFGGFGTMFGNAKPTEVDFRCPTITVLTIRCQVVGPPTRFDVQCQTPACPPVTPGCPTPQCPTLGCHTRQHPLCTIAVNLCGGGPFQVAAGNWPTPMTRCFVC